MKRHDVYRWVPECGKYGHPDRRSAKNHAAKYRRAGHHLRPYLCDRCGWWHVGHLPKAVITGRRTSSEHYTPARQAALDAHRPTPTSPRPPDPRRDQEDTP